MTGQTGVFYTLKFVGIVVVLFGNLISNLTISVGGYIIYLWPIMRLVGYMVGTLIDGVWVLYWWYNMCI